MTTPRILIVNADDFGLSPGINRGVIESHEHGIVTSASLMVRWPAAAEAAAAARTHPHLSLGLHVDLGEWTYKEEGGWQIVYSVVPLEDRSAVAQEVSRQLDDFRQLVGRDPTHIDSHQHVHREEPVHSILTDLAKQLKVPLRGFHPQVRYSGNFYGQTEKGRPYPEAISVEGMIKTLVGLPVGITELGCHPGYADDLQSMYSGIRAQEVQTLCDPRVRKVLVGEGIELGSFALLTRMIEQLKECSTGSRT